jgi:hypothetical protein
MISGELLLVGDNSVSLRLKQGKPDRVRVFFKDDLTELPCGASAPDQLDFQVVNTNGQFFLVIDWVVAAPRAVIWEADY